MRILALDAAMDACSAAVVEVDDGKFEILSARSIPMIRGHAEALIPMVAEIMADSGLSFRDIDRIGVTIGPGTFTGTRIGVAAARGFALANGTTAVGVTTLNAVAMNVGDFLRDGVPVAVFFDASRDEVYGQLFSGSGCSPIDEPRVLSIEDAAGLLPGSGAVVVGSGAHLVAEASLLTTLVLPEINILPDPALVGFLAWSSNRGAIPLYLRPPDAKVQAPVITHVG